QGPLRWTLILVFMFLKAGFIVAIFMHMHWERLALKLAILTPPVAILVLIGLMALEGDYTFLTRIEFFGESDFVQQSTQYEPGRDKLAWWTDFFLCFLIPAYYPARQKNKSDPFYR